MITVAQYFKTPTLSFGLPVDVEITELGTIARRFRSRAETAHYGRFGLTELRRWPQWMLEALPCRGCDSSERQIHSVIAALLGDAAHTILIVLVAAIEFALGNADGGAEGILY